jgi:hypothetical protein
VAGGNVKMKDKGERRGQRNYSEEKCHYLNS